MNNAHNGHDDEPQLQTPVHEGHGHETTDISTRPLVIFVIGLVVALTLVLLVLRGQFALFERIESQPVVDRDPLPPLIDGPRPQPKIQKAPEADMDDLRIEDAARLNAVRWNEPQKTAVIPIDDAMTILVKKGLPTRKEDK